MSLNTYKPISKYLCVHCSWRAPGALSSPDLSPTNVNTQDDANLQTSSNLLAETKRPTELCC